MILPVMEGIQVPQQQQSISQPQDFYDFYSLIQILYQNDTIFYNNSKISHQNQIIFKLNLFKKVLKFYNSSLLIDQMFQNMIWMMIKTIDMNSGSINKIKQIKALFKMIKHRHFFFKSQLPSLQLLINFEIQLKEKQPSQQPNQFETINIIDDCDQSNYRGKKDKVVSGGNQSAENLPWQWK
ncbi:unnamed protein product [Paramecium sonneborni]|nr:unnamed protein product [Paramecium sonneborni]